MLDLLAELQKAGFDVSNVVPDGKWHRFKSERGDKKKSGAYIAFQNFSHETGAPFYVMLYGSWSAGAEWAKYCSIAESAMTKQDRARMQDQLRRARIKAEETRRAEQEETAKRSDAVWKAISDTGPLAPYLAAKGFDGPFGTRFAEIFPAGRCAVVPLRDTEGKLWNLQRIQPDGGKFFEEGGRVTGCFYIVGGEDPGPVVHIAEGLATAISVSLATGEPCICAFNSGNLVPVAKALKTKYPERSFVICGDDDKWKPEKGNAGRDKAEAAAKLVGGTVVFPRFPEGATSGTDFDDLRQAEGLDAVRAQLSSALPMVLDGEQEDYSPQYIVNFPYPDENEKTFSRLDTLENLEELLRRLRIVSRYNVIKKEEETLIPGTSFSQDNRAVCELAHIKSWMVRCKIPTTSVKTYLTSICEARQYNPVLTWIESRPWDGISRLKDFGDTIKGKRDGEPALYDLKHTMLRKWMISAIAAASLPNGVSAHGVLTFQGVQNAGKTHWFKKLAPTHLGLLKDGVTLDPRDKDSVLQFASYWIVELGELDSTFRKADLGALKAFITKDSDELRQAFAERKSKFPRRTIAFASVNDEDFLKDPSGNRRFWTIGVESLNAEHGMDMQQVWAEVLELFRAGEGWYLSREELELLNASNEQFTEVHPVEERIRTSFAWDTASVPRWLHATQVCLEIGMVNPTIADKRHASKALRSLGAREKRTSETVFFEVPPKL